MESANLCLNEKTYFEPVEKLLLHAASTGDVNLLQRLLKSNDGDDRVEYSLWAPLFSAAKEGNSECLALLLEAGGLDEDDLFEWTPLWIATYAGHAECVRLLLDRGAKLEVGQPQTPLCMAADNGELEMLEWFIKSGAEVNIIDKYGRSPLHSAAMKNLPNVAKLLIKGGCFLETVDKEGNTPLLTACIYADTDIIQILLRAGADVNCRSAKSTMPGYTPMHICASKSKKMCIELLWQYGADLFAKSYDGNSVRDAAPYGQCRNYIIGLEGCLRDLKSLCRLKIRKLVASNYLKETFVKKILPRELEEYLNFEIS